MYTHLTISLRLYLYQFNQREYANSLIWMNVLIRVIQ